MRPFVALADVFIGLFHVFLIQRVRFLLAVMSSLIGVATITYKYVEGWTWVDAFYFSVVTVSTVGYGDIVPVTNIGKLFTAFFIISGIGVFVATAGVIADELIGELGSKAEKKTSGKVDD